MNRAKVPQDPESLPPHKIVIMMVVKNIVYFYINNVNLWSNNLKGKRLIDRTLLRWISLPNVPLSEIISVVKQSSIDLHAQCVKEVKIISGFYSHLDFETWFDNMFKVIVHCISNCQEPMLNKRGLVTLYCRRVVQVFKRLEFEDVFETLCNLRKYCNHPPINKKSFMFELTNLRSPPYGKLIQNVNCLKSEPKNIFTNDPFNSSQFTPTFSQSLGQIVSLKGENKGDDMELESHSELDSKSSGESNDAAETLPLKTQDLKTGCKQEQFGPIGSSFFNSESMFAEHMTRTEAANFFMKQVKLILSGENSSGLLPPVALQTKIRQLLKSNSELTLGHFVSYLNLTRIGEYAGAKDSLFLYFNKHQTVRRIDEKFDKFFGFDNWIERFSTLNLGLLHMKFGHIKEAVDTMHLANDHAQMLCDWDCLPQTVSNLYLLQPNKVNHKLLEHVIQPALRNKDYDQATRVVKEFLYRKSIAGCKPASIFTCLEELETSAPNSIGIKENIKSKYAQKACYWNLYGKTHIGLLNSQLALFAKKSSLYDPNYNPDGKSTHESIMMYSIFAEYLYELGDIQTSNYFINHLKNHYSTDAEIKKLWMLAEARINHKTFLKVGNIQCAKDCENLIKILDTQEALYRKAETLVASGEFSQAENVLNELTSDNKIKLQLKVKAFLLMAKLEFQKSDKKNTVSSLQYAYNALLLAKQSNFQSLIIKSGLLIAQLMTYGGYDNTVCLKSIYHEIQSNHDKNLKNRFDYLSILNAVKQKSVSDKVLKECARKLKLLETSAENIQDLSLLRFINYHLAFIYNKLYSKNYDVIDYQEHRNSYAFAYQNLNQQLCQTNLNEIL